jgi:hypothetical protein
LSILPFGISVAEAAVQDLIGPIIIRQRNIGGFIADVTVREDHEDTLVVTENPVEQGAAITDHSFKVPAKLTIDVGYSNSSLQSGGDPNYVQDIYAQFLTLQSSRQPFDVVTGKRMYTNMLITLLHTVTTEETENSLMLTVQMKEVILVNTQTVSVPSSQNMTNPADTGATVNAGTTQSQPAGGVGVSVGTPSAAPFNYPAAPYSAGWGTLSASE